MLEINQTLLKGGTILIVDFNNIFNIPKQGLKKKTP
jgi:hypothetical protein